MDNVSWTTVGISALISAGVSGLVALVADLFARPHLEARKEAILERDRAKRDFRGSLKRIVIAAGALSVPEPQPGQMSDPQLEIYEKERALERARIVDASRTMVERFPEFMGHERSWLQSSLAKMSGLVRGIALSDQTNKEVGQTILVVVSPFNDYLETARWQVKRRRLRRRTAQSHFDALWPTQPTQSSD